MGRSKTQKFADNDANPHIIQEGKPLYDKVKGKWASFFKNSHPISVELACGRGEYTTGLAKVNPDTNYIGVDLKGNRIWTGAQLALRDNLTNVGFLRTHIQNLESFFDHGEISELWIIHPDPRPKDSDERRRVTNNRFLDMYKRLVKPGGIIRFKSDNTGLYEYTMETLEARNDVHILDHTRDLYSSPMLQEHHGITTNYELKFVAEGQTVKVVKWVFKD